jgi:acetyl-CoA carboxylase carboxyl transferase subunit alpha
MAKDTVRERFAYDFEAPVVEIERQIQALFDRVTAENVDLSRQIREMEAKRDTVLKKIVEDLTAFQRVKLARHPLRPHSLDYVAMMCKDFTELHGDRRFGDDRAILTGLGTVDGRRVLFIAQQKGRETRDKMVSNFGMPQPEGYRKALAKMRLAEKFQLPVVCLIDTPGAAPAVGAEERGQAAAIAENIFVMAGLPVPIVIVVTGEGCSGGALGIGVGDRFAMLENAYYSVISPEGCAAILYKDGAKAPEAADAMKLTAQDMLDAGIIETIISEPIGGAHRDSAAAGASVKDYVTKTLNELSALPTQRLLDERYARYRCLGVYKEVEPVVAEPEPEPEPEFEP